MMEDAGVRVRWFRPLHRLRPTTKNHRTHRKVMIVDEATGFTGGVGIADEWYGDARNENEWRDTHFRVRGPAVDGLRAAFLDNWVETDAELFDRTVDRFPEQPKPGEAVIQCVRGARRSGGATSRPCCSPCSSSPRNASGSRPRTSSPTRSCSTGSVRRGRRGVRWRSCSPDRTPTSASCSWRGEAGYERLLEHGVRIWQFQPTMLHAKIMTVDGLVANVGSANLNARSTELDEEINLVVLDPDWSGALDDQFDEDLERSEEIEPGRWEERSAGEAGARGYDQAVPALGLNGPGRCRAMRVGV